AVGELGRAGDRGVEAQELRIDPEQRDDLIVGRRRLSAGMDRLELADDLAGLLDLVVPRERLREQLAAQLGILAYLVDLVDNRIQPRDQVVVPLLRIVELAVGELDVAGE